MAERIHLELCFKIYVHHACSGHRKHDLPGASTHTKNGLGIWTLMILVSINCWTEVDPELPELIEALQTTE